MCIKSGFKNLTNLNELLLHRNEINTSAEDTTTALIAEAVAAATAAANVEGESAGNNRTLF